MGQKTVNELLKFGRENKLFPASKRLAESLDRKRREEIYDEEKHAMEKGDWLADAFFDMDLKEISRYCEFIENNTEFSTQHGVKGEEYNSVLVVFDDVGSAWNNYNFAKTLTPKSAGGEPTERQRRLTTNLAYVCFSRAEKDLRIIMFSGDAATAKKELVDQKLFLEAQIEVV